MSYDGPNPIVVNAGGTGSSSFTAYGPVVAASTTTGALTSVTPSATSGVPFISKGSSTLPAFGTAVVAGGGTGIITTTAYGVICGGTTATGAFQNAGAGTSGQLLQSGGASALPAYTTSTYPATNATNTLLYASSANTMAALATADNGVLITSAAGVPSILAAGTTGQVLTATTGSPPSWGAAAGGSNLVLIQSQTASNSANINFTSGITSTYTTYFLIWTNVVPVSNSAHMEMQFSVNGGSSYLATNYLAGNNIYAYNSAVWTNSTSTTYFDLGGGLSNTAATGSCGNLYFYGLTTANTPMALGSVNFWQGTNIYTGQIGGYNTTTSGVNAFSIFMSAGNISTGKFTLFGVLE